MKALKLLGLTAIAASLALTTGCSTKQRKGKLGTLGANGVSYTNGVSGTGGDGYAFGDGSGVGGANAGIGNNNGMQYSKSGTPGTGGNNIVYFDYDSTALSRKSFAKLNKHVAYLKQNPNTQVSLAGHADERGTREYNAALGERRAMSVKDYLVTNGVNHAQISTVSYGEERPVGTFQQNRRVEVTY